MNDNLHTLKVVRAFTLIIGLIMFSLTIFSMILFKVIGIKLNIPIDSNTIFYCIILLLCLLCIMFSFYLDERINRKENANNWKEFKQSRNGTNTQ
jgi:cytochrome b subunit of formate dehydrogenase